MRPVCDMQRCSVLWRRHGGVSGQRFVTYVPQWAPQPMISSPAARSSRDTEPPPFLLQAQNQHSSPNRQRRGRGEPSWRALIPSRHCSVPDGHQSCRMGRQPPKAAQTTGPDLWSESCAEACTPVISVLLHECHGYGFLAPVWTHQCVSAPLCEPCSAKVRRGWPQIPTTKNGRKIIRTPQVRKTENNGLTRSAIFALSKKKMSAPSVPHSIVADYGPVESSPAPTFQGFGGSIHLSIYRSAQPEIRPRLGALRRGPKNPSHHWAALCSKANGQWSHNQSHHVHSKHNGQHHGGRIQDT